MKGLIDQLWTRSYFYLQHHGFYKEKSTNFYTSRVYIFDDNMGAYTIQNPSDLGRIFLLSIFFENGTYINNNFGVKYSFNL